MINSDCLALDIMKKLLVSTGILAVTPILGYGITYSKINKERIDGCVFYNKEIRFNYKELSKQFAPLEENIKKMNESFSKGHIGIMGLYYDNPKWLIDVNKARSSIGYMVKNELKPEDKNRIPRDMKPVQIPSFMAMTIPLPPILTETLYPVCTMILCSKYFKEYCQTMIDMGEKNLPIGDITTGKYQKMFIPLPNELKHFKFISLTTPELNNKGKEHEKRHTKVL